MNIEFRELSINELLNDANKDELISAYSSESKCDAVPDYYPDTELYELMEEQGMLDTIGAFDGDKLVGFITSVTYRLPKYSTLGTTTEYFFVLKEYRTGGTGLKLLKRIEEKAKQRNATSFFLSAPLNGSLDRIAERALGLTKSHAIYSKEL